MAVEQEQEEEEEGLFESGWHFVQSRNIDGRRFVLRISKRGVWSMFGNGTYGYDLRPSSFRKPWIPFLLSVSADLGTFASLVYIYQLLLVSDIMMRL